MNENNENEALNKTDVMQSVTASELRIGNLVTIDNQVYWPKLKSVPFSVTGILGHSISLGNIFKVPSPFDKNYSQKPCYIKPIILTEEWLLKFGFVKKDKKWNDKSISKGLFFKDRYFIENSREGFLFCQTHYSGDSWFLKNIEYVHQLQNLYLALTGCELTVA